jgi:BT1 family
MDRTQPMSLRGYVATAGPRWFNSLLRPIQAFRIRYLPLLMIYFAYGALGIIDVSRDMWIKERLTLSPSELASIAVWLSLPWTVKMVFGELVDSLPIFGSQRRSYILIGAMLTACGMLTLAGAASGRLAVLLPHQLYLCARTIAIIDAATTSPFAQLSMIPLLTLTAFYAPAGHRATWFALMASLMNLALIAGQLQTKYLNQFFIVGRGDYSELGLLLIMTVTIGFVLSLSAIALFGRRV